MGSKRKKAKTKTPLPTQGGVKFELEADADALFQEYLKQVPSWAEKEEEALVGKRPSQPAPRKSAQAPSELVIDLHGLHLDEACAAVDRSIREALRTRGPLIRMKIITGKGRHSGADGGVLARELHRFVWLNFRKKIVRIDESPAAVTLGGLPVRGYFNVVLKCDASS